MAKHVDVPLAWTRIDWHPGDTWKKVTLPRLLDKGVDPRHIERTVYVIRLNGDYAISYPNGDTPTVYIGEGNFSSRINNHRSWVSEIEDLVGEFSFQVCISTPRVRNREFAYQDTEAALLERFGTKFHSAPLWNKPNVAATHTTSRTSGRWTGCCARGAGPDTSGRFAHCDRHRSLRATRRPICNGRRPGDQACLSKNSRLSIPDRCGRRDQLFCILAAAAAPLAPDAAVTYHCRGRVGEQTRWSTDPSPAT